MKYLPTVFTLLNLCSGFVAIVFSFRGKYEYSLMMIVLAVGFDILDGKLARHLKAESDFGVEIDAFSDVISFGALPGFCIYQFFHDILASDGMIEVLGLLMGLGYTIPGFIRLARFNTQQSAESQSKDFIGLPMPPLGILIISIICLGNHFTNLHQAFVFVLLSLTIPFGSFLMVSKIRYRSFKTFFTMKFILMLFAFTLIILGVTYSFSSLMIFVYLCMAASVIYIVQPMFPLKV